MSDDDWAATNRPSTHSFDGIYDDDGESDGSYRSDDDYGRVCDGGDNGGGGSSGNGRGKAPARLSPVVIQHDCSPCSLKSHVSGGGNGYDAFEQHDAQMTKEVGRLLEELNEKMYDVKKKKKIIKQQQAETAEDQENDEDGEPLDQLALDNKRRRNLVQRHNFETHRNPQQVHMVPKVEEWTRKFPHFRICGTGCLSISPAAMLATTATTATATAATTTASNQPGQEQDGDELEIATLPSLRPLVYRKSFSSTDDGSWSNNHASGLLSLDELCVAGKGMVCDVTQRDGVVGEESVVEIFAADGEYSEFILCDYEKGDDDEEKKKKKGEKNTKLMNKTMVDDDEERRRRHLEAGLPPVEPEMALREMLMSELVRPLWLSAVALMGPLLRSLQQRVSRMMERENRENRENREKEKVYQTSEVEGETTGRRRKQAAARPLESSSSSGGLGGGGGGGTRLSAGPISSLEKDRGTNSVSLGLAMTITSLHLQSSGAALLTDQGDSSTSLSSSSSSSRWVLDERQTHNVAPSKNKIQNSFGTSSHTSSHTSSQPLQQGFVGHTLQPTLAPSGPSSDGPMAAFGAGGYRMHRPTSNTVDRERFHHRSSFFQRQGSATMRSSSAVSSVGSSSASSPRGSKVPSHYQYAGRRFGADQTQSTSASMVGQMVGQNHHNHNHQLPSLQSSSGGVGSSGMSMSKNRGTSPVRVRTALPTVGGDRGKHHDHFSNHLPSLCPSDFLSTAGLIAGNGLTPSTTTNNGTNQHVKQDHDRRRWGQDPRSSMQRVGRR